MPAFGWNGRAGSRIAIKDCTGGSGVCRTAGWAAPDGGVAEPQRAHVEAGDGRGWRRSAQLRHWGLRLLTLGCGVWLHDCSGAGGRIEEPRPLWTGTMSRARLTPWRGRRSLSSSSSPPAWANRTINGAGRAGALRRAVMRNRWTPPFAVARSWTPPCVAVAEDRCGSRTSARAWLRPPLKLRCRPSAYAGHQLRRSRCARSSGRRC